MSIKVKRGTRPPGAPVALCLAEQLPTDRETHDDDRERNPVVGCEVREVSGEDDYFSHVFVFLLGARHGGITVLSLRVAEKVRRALEPDVGRSAPREFDHQSTLQRRSAT